MPPRLRDQHFPNERDNLSVAFLIIFAFQPVTSGALSLTNAMDNRAARHLC